MDNPTTVVIAWTGFPAPTVESITLQSKQLQSVFGLKPSVRVVGSALYVYSDKNEYIKIWFETPYFLQEYLRNDQLAKLPFAPTGCLALEFRKYARNEKPVNDPNYRRTDLDPDLAEHLWDRMICRFQEQTVGVLIVDGEGVYDVDHRLIVDFS